MCYAREDFLFSMGHRSRKPSGRFDRSNFVHDRRSSIYEVYDLTINLVNLLPAYRQLVFDRSLLTEPDMTHS